MIERGHLKLGKKPVKHDPRTLLYKCYRDHPLPVPTSYGLSSKMTNLGPMLNNNLGDCTCAGIGHLIQAWTAEIGSQVILPDSVILDLYEKTCGYTPSDPSTDQGGVELDILNYWRKNPIQGNPLDSYVALDFKNDQKVKESIYYFGGTYTGVELPLAWQTAKVWDIATGNAGVPGSWGGHCVPFVDYNETGPVCISWEEYIQITWAAVAEYWTEAYCLFSPSMIYGGKSIEGFDVDALRADMQAIGA
jgi:hypothetical protein